MTQTPTKPILYTYPGCGYTDDLKRELRKKAVEYDEVDLSRHLERIPELLALTDGDRLTPVFVDGDDVQIGHNGIGCTF
jgi:glutaredoxin